MLTGLRSLLLTSKEGYINFYLGFLMIWMASSKLMLSGIMMRQLIFMMSQWHFLGSPRRPVKEASGLVLNRVGKGPAMRSPSKRVESVGQVLIFTVGMLSPQNVLILIYRKDCELHIFKDFDLELNERI